MFVELTCCILQRLEAVVRPTVRSPWRDTDIPPQFRSSGPVLLSDGRAERDHVVRGFAGPIRFAYRSLSPSWYRDVLYLLVAP